jgi:putative nucleotidyltransferase with HDIG domain
MPPSSPFQSRFRATAAVAHAPTQSLPRKPPLRSRLDKHLAELPVLPIVVSKLMALDPRSDRHFEEVRLLIESEPSFTARILAAANSAASAPRSPITSVRAAIMRMGSVPAANVVLTLAMAHVFVPRDPWEKSLWRHSLDVAVAARKIAACSAASGLKPEEAYACGLLHDIGRFVLFREAPDELRRVEGTHEGTPETLVEAERAICGMTHAEIGALACAKWRLPELVTAVVRDHHGPAGSGPVGLVRLADHAMFDAERQRDAAEAPPSPELRIERLVALQPELASLTAEELLLLVDASLVESEPIAQLIGIG